MSNPLTSSPSEIVIPADSSSNAIAAVIPGDQTLVSGGTIPLRLAEDILVHEIRIASGNWFYGTATISGDRLLVHVRSIRDGRDLYPTDLQVYDLDGLPGIHIPDVLSQDVARESATESIGGLNLVTADPSARRTGSRRGNPGGKRPCLAGKPDWSKSRCGRVMKCCWKNSNGKLSGVYRPSVPAEKQVSFDIHKDQPLGFVPGGSFLQRSRSEGVELRLQGIYLKDSLRWFALEWQNHLAIDFTPLTSTS